MTAIAVGWAIIAALAVAMLLRELAPEWSRGLVLLAALTPLLYFPAWVVAVSAAVARQWPLAIAAIAVVGVHLWWLSPTFVGGRGALHHSATTVTVLSMNLNGDRATGSAAARVIDATRPDVVVLSEASPTSTAGLDVAGYPTVASDITVGTNGWMVLSRWPLLTQRTVRLGDRTMPRLVLRTPTGGQLVVWQVHPVAPVRGYVGQWRRQLHDIRQAIQPDLHDGLDVVAAGDFNASRDLPGFGRLLGDGWADAADGRGFLFTWPVGTTLPRLFRLDHVLVSQHIGVASVHATRSYGSDHVGVLARLELAR